MRWYLLISSLFYAHRFIDSALAFYAFHPHYPISSPLAFDKKTAKLLNPTTYLPLKSSLILLVFPRAEMYSIIMYFTKENSYVK